MKATADTITANQFVEFVCVEWYAAARTTTSDTTATSAPTTGLIGAFDASVYSVTASAGNIVINFAK
ncbi:hypothetical protein [uncultured Sphingomonas sp.]|uniref:hypothetical protein n=1 Tax=uncultured Sphingomonas sp. TaxID=158754 RepID=UPI0035C98408